MDQIMEMLVKYANNLEDLVNERTRLLYEEKQKTEDLLHRMLPKSVYTINAFEQISNDKR
jgi:guanylate cyclase, other